MRGIISNDQRVYRYESPFLLQGENDLSLSELRNIFIRQLTGNPQAKYVANNYALEKDKRTISVWRKDGKTLSDDEQARIDQVLPRIFEMY